MRYKLKLEKLQKINDEELKLKEQAEKALQKLQQIKAKEKRIHQKKTQLLIKQLEAYDIDITEIDMITAAVLYVQNNHLVEDALQAFRTNGDEPVTPNNGDVI